MPDARPTPRNDGGAALIRVRSIFTRLQQSLFFVPFVMVVLAIVASRGLVTLDDGLDPRDLPTVLVTTVESARTILAPS